MGGGDTPSHLFKNLGLKGGEEMKVLVVRKWIDDTVTVIGRKEKNCKIVKSTFKIMGESK